MITTNPAPPPISPLPAFADILRERQEFATGAQDDRVSEQVNGWFDRLLLQSGLELSPSMILMISLCSAATGGGLAFVLQENLLTTALGFLIGFIVPTLVIVVIRSRRQSAITNQMPGMVDELARAAKTGRSLEQCLELVMQDTPAPLGDELRLCVQRMELGMALPEAIRDMPNRTGVVSMNILRTALSVHHQTGGDLVSVLDRLARTIRDRISFLGRLRAATSASRASAIMMLGLPPAIVTFFVFRDPNYFERLMNATWGRNITILAIVLQVIGALWVLKILKSSQQS